jgi:hypothetical protein
MELEDPFEDEIHTVTFADEDGTVRKVDMTVGQLLELNAMGSLPTPCTTRASR